MGNTLAVLTQTDLRWNSCGFCSLAVALGTIIITSWYHMQTQVLWTFSWTQTHFIVSSEVLEKEYWPGVYKELQSSKVQPHKRLLFPWTVVFQSDGLLNSHSHFLSYTYVTTEYVKYFQYASPSVSVTFPQLLFSVPINMTIIFFR